MSVRLGVGMVGRRMLSDGGRAQLDSIFRLNISFATHTPPESGYPRCNNQKQRNLRASERSEYTGHGKAHMGVLRSAWDFCACVCAVGRTPWLAPSRVRGGVAAYLRRRRRAPGGSRRRHPPRRRPSPPRASSALPPPHQLCHLPQRCHAADGRARPSGSGSQSPLWRRLARAGDALASPSPPLAPPLPRQRPGGRCPGGRRRRAQPSIFRVRATCRPPSRCRRPARQARRQAS